MRIAWSIIKSLLAIAMCCIFIWEIWHGKVADATLSGVIILMLGQK